MTTTPTVTPVRTETIQCPECNTIQDATVTQVEGAPWPSFVHTCEKCGYVIMESEWEAVEIKPYLQYLDELRESGVPPIVANSVVSGTAWGLELNQFYPVTGIVKSSNLWGDKPVAHAGDHTFFLIEGCKDTEQGKGRGFFNEMLKPELREIRKTLEAYTANTPIADGESASACGLGFSKDGEWGVTLRVTTGTVTATYKLDRFD